MSFYYVDQSLISNLIDPYQLLEEKISKLEIAEVLENGIFDEDKTLTNKENILRKICFLIINEDLLKIHIQFNENTIFSSDIYSLIASLYKTKEKIFIYIDEKDIEKAIKILNINSEEFFIKENIITFEKSKFSWDNIEDLSQDTWSNESFILSKIKQDNNFKEILKYVEPSKWENVEFLKKIWEQNPNFIYGLEQKVMASDSMFELLVFSIAKENNGNLKLLTYIFDSYIKNIWVQNKENYNTTLYKLKNLRSDNFNTEEEFNIKKNELIELNEQSKKFIDRLTNEILINKELIKSVISLFISKESKTIHLPSLYLLLPKQLKKDKEILKLYFEASLIVNMNLENFIEQEAFKDEELLELFIKKGSFNVSKTHAHIYDHWIGDKEKLLKYSKLTRNNITNRRDNDKANDPFLVFLTMIPKVMRKDEDIMGMFISKNPKIYHTLSEEMRNKKKILFAYISDIPGLQMTYHLDKIPDTLLLSLDKDDLIVLLDKLPELALRDSTQKWLEDKDLVASLGDVFKQLVLSDKVKEQIFSSESSTLKILQKEITHFSLIPKEYRNNINIAKYYIKHCYYPDLKLISKQLWSSIDFCLNFIETKKTCSSEISPLIWNNKVFILELAKRIEEGKIEIMLLNKGPQKINELINLYEIKKDTVYSFFNNYFTKIELERNLTTTNVVKKKNKI